MKKDRPVDPESRRKARRKARKLKADAIERRHLNWVHSWPPYSYDRVRVENRGHPTIYGRRTDA